MAFLATAPDFAAGLLSQLQARPGLNGVKVHLVAPEGTLDLDDAIVLLREKAPEQIDWAALGRRRLDDTATLPGLIRVYRNADVAGLQDSTAVFRTAADRAKVLLNEVALQVRDDPPAVGDQTIEAHVSDVAWVPVLAEPGGWIVDCEFSVHYRARVGG